MTAIPQNEPLIEQKTKEKIKKWSFSRLSMFEGCQRQFYYKYILELPYPSAYPMRIGKIFHTAIDLMVKEGYSPHEALYYSIGVNEGLPEGEKTSFLLYMLRKAYERIPNLEYAEISSEVHLEIKTTKGIVHGYIDLIIDDPSQDLIELWDYKTSWHAFSAETHMQLPLYGWLYQQLKYTGSNFKGRLIFPRLDPENDTVVDLTVDKLTEARNWLVRTINQIEAKNPDVLEDWEMCKDRSKCDYCPFVSRCAGTLLNGLPSTGEPTSIKEAEQIGAFILAQETALKNMKNGLKKWVEENDPVKVGAGSWVHQASEPKAKCEDVEALVDYAIRYGLDIKEALSAKSATLDKWLQQDETGELNQLISYSKGRKSLRFVN
ncbi:PD-(D/E)XK nuclease family protein [Bacillus sp. FJAT-29937]|uniref:PD-(D/E)XK nuclease family protein n=1 Tax=Bacillus sp. FJAT-29937 TaxID=1720553 RepID=UPI000837774E|nr:PD-(D/E)XK nuclease family protein [Bacillus sp. FJAT-29937]